MIAWLDIETTGADERVGHMLELGIVLTDDNLERIGEPFSEVICPLHPDIMVGVFDGMSEVVQEMHQRNGLRADVLARGEYLSDVEDHARAWLDEYHPSRSHVALAGSGVAHFDSRWLTRHMPVLRSRFTYWAYDVGVVRRFLRLAGREDAVLPQPEKTHRALDDALQHLEEARHYVGILRGVAVPA